MITVNVRDRAETICFFATHSGKLIQGAAGPGRHKPAADEELHGSGRRTLPPDPLCSTFSCHFTSFSGGPFEISGTLYTVVQIEPQSLTAAFFMAKIRYAASHTNVPTSSAVHVRLYRAPIATEYYRGLQMMGYSSIKNAPRKPTFTSISH